METTLLLISLILILCMLLHRYIEYLPIPSLLIFIMIGMLVGENGIFKVHFDDFSVANDVCTIALIFIMFYGGFGTNLNAARSVLRQSVLLSTVGVALTAGITGACLHFILDLSWSEALLIGSVIASTDAASVFTLLRTKNLNLKDNTASMLEVESGSNDPMSYMLTVVFVTSMLGSDLSVPTLLFQQVFFGVLFGVAIAYATIFLIRRVKFAVSQGETILIFSVALLAFALPSIVNGNGYLSAYLAGIFLGNTSFSGKRDLVRFFDVVTHVAQVMVFFLLGLLVSPAQLPETIFPAFVIMLVLTFVARPISAVLILAPFGASKQQMTLLSWAGLRGVASIVFSIYVVLAAVPMTYNLFNLVFCIVLMSMALQGSLLSKMSSVLDMIDDSVDVRNTFNYYQEEAKVNFSRTAVSPSHPWVSKYIKDISTPPETLIALLIRTTEKKKTFITPNGNTQILAGDVLVFASRAFENRANLFLREIAIDAGHPLCGLFIKDSSDFLGKELVVMIQRGGNPIIPSGDTRLEAGDLLVLAEFEEEIAR